MNYQYPNTKLTLILKYLNLKTNKKITLLINLQKQGQKKGDFKKDFYSIYKKAT